MATQDLPMNVRTDTLIQELSVFMRRARITESELITLSRALDVLVRVKLDELC
jgi:hypothetical protein